jgi:hypothetical protein
MDDGADKLRGAVEEGFEIKGGVEGIAQLHEVGDIGRVYAGVDGVKRGGLVGGTVVAFKLGLVRRRWGIR